MAESSPERRFTRIDRLPPYVFNITAELKMAARRRGEDIIDFSMGNPDGATQARDPPRGRVTMGVRPLSNGAEFFHDMRRRRAIGITHTEIDNIFAAPASRHFTLV